MSFRVFDLRTQAKAVQKLLEGKSKEEKIQWLSVRGSLIENPMSPNTYEFESREGIRHLFFFEGDEMVFIGDHFTTTAASED